ncbi:MAG: hypothetical protein C0467_04560 [Planctomycetaceae bacterium]|nr:hypothetical protein [Planctomycetaceae bacterium]
MHPSEPAPQLRLGDICGVAALLVLVLGLFFPARPGGQTETMAWVFVGAVCVIATLGGLGLWWGGALGRVAGGASLMFVALIVCSVQGWFR